MLAERRSFPKKRSISSDFGLCRIFFAERVYDRGNPGIKSGQDEDRNLDWSGVRRRVKTDRDIVDDRKGITTKDNRIFGEVGSERFWRKEKAA